MTVGNANVAVRSIDESGGYRGGGFIPVAFAFDEGPGYRVHGRCKMDPSHTSAH